MGHYGKHRIDRETGLCEICDKTALQKVRQHNRPKKQTLYSNDDEILYDEDPYDVEITPRPARKPNHILPTVRPRRTVYEQPIEEPMRLRRKIVRREQTPTEEIEIHRPPVRPSPHYYVDRDDEPVPQRISPRRYTVKDPPPPQGRAVRVVRQRVETPPPLEYETRRIQTKRQIKSDIDATPRYYPRREINDSYDYKKPPSKIEMYSIEAFPTHDSFPSRDTPIYRSQDDLPTTRKFFNPRDQNQKRSRLEPVERKPHDQPSPTVVRRVYKKLPPGRNDPYDDDYYPNETQSQIIRKPARSYGSSPQLTNQNNKNPAIFYVRSVNDHYE